MGNRRTPNKLLVPANRPERPCPHEYSDEEELVVEVDCASCNGAQDMENARCFTGLMNIVMAGAAPGSIVLRRYIDKRYRGPAVQRVLAAAEQLASVNRAIGALPAVSDRRCRTCPASTERILGAIRHAMTRDPIAYSAAPATIPEMLREAADGTECDEREECLRKASRLLLVGRR